MCGKVSPLTMDKKSISQRLLELSGPEKRISCTDARELAREAGTDYAAIGALCDELGIRVFGCELGCF